MGNCIGEFLTMNRNYNIFKSIKAFKSAPCKQTEEKMMGFLRETKFFLPIKEYDYKGILINTGTQTLLISKEYITGEEQSLMQSAIQTQSVDADETIYIGTS